MLAPMVGAFLSVWAQVFGYTFRTTEDEFTSFYVSFDRYGSMIEFLYLILIGIGIYLAIIGFRHIRIWVTSFYYRRIIRFYKWHGLKFLSYYTYKGKGLVYCKELEKSLVDSVLIRYGYPPINMSTEYAIYEYRAVIRYPEWEERLYSIGSKHHGGIKLFHFYSLILIINNEIVNKTLTEYLNDDMEGEYLYEWALKDNNLEIEHHLSRDLKYIAKDLNEEINHWKQYLSNTKVRDSSKLQSKKVMY